MPENQVAAPSTNTAPTPAATPAISDLRSHLRRRNDPRLRMFAIIGVIILVIVGIFLWRYFTSYESTDDAQIDGHVNSISTRISGHVVKLNVQDNQLVQAGTVLVEIDPTDYQVAVERAQADYNDARAQADAAAVSIPVTSVSTSSQLSSADADVINAQAGIKAAQQQFDAAKANLQQAEANNVKAQNDLARYKQLVEKQEISQQQYDQTVASAKGGAAGVDASRASADAANAQVTQAEGKLAQSLANQRNAGTAPKQVQIIRARAASALAAAARKRADLDQAQLNLSYTRVVAPVTGVVSDRTVEVGQNVQPGQELLKLIPLEDIWVTANFKETQLRDMKPGQKATIYVDATGKKYKGHVDSVAGASGARFSLLPPRTPPATMSKLCSAFRLSWSSNPGRRRDTNCVLACLSSPRSGRENEHGHGHHESGGGMAPGRQSLDHRRRGDVSYLHGGARHQHRQRGVAAHCRQPFGWAGREYLGFNFLPGVERHRAAPQWMALLDRWPQALLHGLRGAVYDQLFFVRIRTQSSRTHHFPDSARRRRRRSAAQ